MILKHTSGKHSFSTAYWLKYTALFCVVCLLVFLPFLTQGKSLVFTDANGGGDGLVIHYNSFLYYGKFLRDIARTLFETGKLVIPMWDTSIGLGQDIIQTLWFYVIGNPFAALSALIPTQFSELGYCLITILELYTAGLCFSAYSKHMKNEEWATLIASLVYSFSSYPLYISTLHPYFSLPLVFLPLVLIGVEKLLRNRISIYYVVVLGIAALSNFYFFYMIAVFVFLYALLRCLFLYGLKDIKRILAIFIRVLWHSVLGVGLSAVLMLPSIYSLLSANRAVGGGNYIPLHYSAKYYSNLLGQFIIGGGKYYVYMGYTALAVICLMAIVLYAIRGEKKYIQITIAFAVLAIGLCIPYFAHMMNGFSYVTNRWIWAFGFVTVFIIATALPAILSMQDRDWSVISIYVLIYGFFTGVLSYNRTIPYFASIALLYAGVLIITLLRKNNTDDLIKVRILILFAVVCIASNAYFAYSPKEGNYIANFSKRGEVYKSLVKQAPGYALKGISDAELNRYDTAGISTDDTKRNSSMILKKYGTSYYYSTNGGAFPAFAADMELNYAMEQTYNNLDRRSFIDALLGVKYVIIERGEEGYLPFGYTQLVSETDKYCVYESKNYLPMAFVTDKMISLSSYNRLNSVKKQHALLQGVVLEDGVEDIGLTVVDPTFNDEELQYIITDMNGLEIHDNKVDVLAENATMTIQFPNRKDGELYFRFEGLDFLAESEEDVSTLVKMYVNDSFVTEIHYLNPKSPYYSGKHDFLVNLGYDEKGRSSVTVGFKRKGQYTFDKLEVFFQPCAGFDDMVAKLRQGKADRLEIFKDSINCQTHSDNDGVVFFSLPYTEGWKAFVNGKEEVVLRADNAFLAVPVSAGECNVVLKYRTPLMREGLFVSLGSLACVFAIVIIRKRKKRVEI